MLSTWVAVDAETDALAWAKLLRRAYHLSIQEGSRPASILRPVIVDSWARCSAAGVDHAGTASVVLGPEEARRRFAAHALAPLLPVVETLLVSVAQHARQVAVLADRDGMVLWTGGRPDAVAGARRSRFLPGALWSEQGAGTNALGTSLVLDHPVQVFSAEHFKESMHGLSGAAAPVHDPATGAILGVVGLTGPLRAAHPHGYSVVLAAVQILETQLAHHVAQRDERLKVQYLQRVLGGCSTSSAVVNREGRVLLSRPQGWLGNQLDVRDGVPVSPPAGALRLEPLPHGEGHIVFRARGADTGLPVLRLEALGRERARVRVGDVELELSRRHSEVLAVLALHRDGLTHAELGEAVYGTATKGVTVRAEICRLRKALGPVLTASPYRLVADLRADFLEVERLLSRGCASAALAAYPGELLPGSHAPGLLPTRQRLAAAIEAAGSQPLTSALSRAFAGS